MNAKPPRRRGSSWIWLQGLASGALLTLATPLALLLGALLLPGLAMLLIDRHSGKPIARAMLFAGAATCLGPVQALWTAGMSLTAALDILADVSTLGGAWAAAALAWLAAELAPLLAGALAEFSWRRRDAELARRRRELEEEWGLPPAETAFLPEKDGPPEGTAGRGPARFIPSPPGPTDRAAREAGGLAPAAPPGAPPPLAATLPLPAAPSGMSASDPTRATVRSAGAR